MSVHNIYTGEIIDAAMIIHKDIGPGLFESIYERLLADELRRRGRTVETQQLITFGYRGITYENAFRVDMLVEKCVIVELKSTEQIVPVHSKQLLTYMKLMNMPVGLLINFGEALLKNGIKRIVHTPTSITR